MERVEITHIIKRQIVTLKYMGVVIHYRNNNERNERSWCSGFLNEQFEH